VLAQQSGRIEAGQQRCLTGCALRPAGHSHLGIKRDEVSAGPSRASGALHGSCPTEQAREGGVSTCVVACCQRVEGRVIFAYANTV
jgi:hypothetical protein